jgi:thiol-disulfide isomerase/thioredoxin
MKRVLIWLSCLGLISLSSFGQTAGTDAPAPARSAMARGPQPGSPAPALVAVGPDGREVNLADFRGKVVLLDIWATWCGPCIAAMPKNSELAEKYAADGFVVLAVCASDTRENYDGWVARNGDKYRFVTAHDPAGRDFKNSPIARDWGVSMFPSYFVIGRDGTIVGRAAGGGPNENPAVLRLLAKAGLPVPAPQLPAEKVEKPVSAPIVVRPASEPATPTMRFANMAAGETVPDFETLDLAGRSVKLSDFKGRAVFISFWTGSRNPPSDVAQLHANYAAQGLAVWAINTATERADFEKWARDEASSLGHTVSWDPAGRAVMEAISHMIFGAGMYPAYCVINADGKLVGGTIGMGPRVSGLLREIVSRAGIKLTEADRAAVEEVLAALRAGASNSVADATPTAPARMPAGMIAAAPAAAPSAPRRATLAVGDVAPDFAMRTVDGRELKLSDFNGKVVILDFWATWCGPCIASFPHTQAIAAKYKDQDVVVLASGTSDTIAAFQKWIPANQPKYPDMVWAFDPNERGGATFDERASSKLYGVSGIPTQFVIGRDGKIGAVIVGNGGKEDARTEAALAALDVKVDESLVTKGQEQIRAAGQRDRERAEAARTPRAPFNEDFGKLKSGEAAPATAEVLTLDGKRVALSELAPGRVKVIGVWSGGNGPGEGYLAQWRDWSAKYPDVAFVGIGGYASEEDVRNWQEANRSLYPFALYADPTGAPPRPAKPMDEMTDEEKAAYRTATRAHYDESFTVKLGGVMAPVPATIVFDRAGQLAGWSAGFGDRYSETIGNLLLRAGVVLAEADRPQRVWSAAETKPAPPEPRGEMLKIGATAPDFTTQTLDGKDVKLSDYRGKVVVLDFWATWCGPCMTAMPHTQEVAAKYKDQDVVVLGSCTSDTRAKFEEWVRRNQDKYPDIVWTHDPAERGTERASNKLYGVRGIPTQFIIDRQGKVVDIVVGYMKGEVILDASLAKAGVQVAPEVLEQAAKQLKARGN